MGKRKTEQQGREQKEKHTHKPLTSMNRENKSDFRTVFSFQNFFKRVYIAPLVSSKKEVGSVFYMAG